MEDVPQALAPVPSGEESEDSPCLIDLAAAARASLRRELGSRAGAMGLDRMGAGDAADWTDEEQRNFARGFLAFEKDFASIQRRYLPIKPVRRVVAFYYNMWKTKLCPFREEVELEHARAKAAEAEAAEAAGTSTSGGTGGGGSKKRKGGSEGGAAPSKKLPPLPLTDCPLEDILGFCRAVARGAQAGTADQLFPPPPPPPPRETEAEPQTAAAAVTGYGILERRRQVRSVRKALLQAGASERADRAAGPARAGCKREAASMAENEVIVSKRIRAPTALFWRPT